MRKVCSPPAPPGYPPIHPSTCYRCRFSESARAEIEAAINAKRGRPIEPAEYTWLFDEIGWTRCKMLKVHSAAESTKEAIKAKRQRHAEMAVLKAAIKLMEERYPPEDWDEAHPVLIAPVETTVKKLKLMLSSMISSSDITYALRSAISDAGLEYASLSNSRMNKKLALEVLVHHCTRAWLELTDEAVNQLRIGHPDHPGPFLRYLSASADGMPGGITLNSLHAKARELAGRRV